jgi:hypothetical protein
LDIVSNQQRIDCHSFEKISNILLAAQYGRLFDSDDDFDRDNGNYYVLHAALGLRAKNEIVAWIVNGFDGARRPLVKTTTQQRRLIQTKRGVRKRDVFNNLPLHYAVKIPVFAQRPSYIIKTLLKVYPQAALYEDPTTRRLPLHVAVSNGYRWEDGIRELYSCNLTANEVGDYHPGYTTHNFPPFLLAAIYSDDIETTYCLLRQFPTLVESAIA